MSRKAVRGHSLHGPEHMVAIGSTVKERALALRVGYLAWNPGSARRRPAEGCFPIN